MYDAELFTQCYWFAKIKKMNKLCEVLTYTSYCLKVDNHLFPHVT